MYWPRGVSPATQSSSSASIQGNRNVNQQQQHRLSRPHNNHRHIIQYSRVQHMVVNQDQPVFRPQNNGGILVLHAGTPMYPQYFHQYPFPPLGHQPVQVPDTQYQYDSTQLIRPTHYASSVQVPRPQIRHTSNAIRSATAPQIQEVRPMRAVAPIQAVTSMQAVPQMQTVAIHPAYRATQTPLHSVQMPVACSSVPGISTENQFNGQSRPKRRTHAVDIINPITHVNVLDELTETHVTHICKNNHMPHTPCDIGTNYNIGHQGVSYSNSVYYSHTVSPSNVFPSSCSKAPPCLPTGPASAELSINTLNYFVTNVSHRKKPAFEDCRTSNLEQDTQLNTDEDIEVTFGTEIGLWMDQSTPVDTVSTVEDEITEIEYTDTETSLKPCMDIQNTDEEECADLDEILKRMVEAIPQSPSQQTTSIETDINSTSHSNSNISLLENEPSIPGNLADCEKEFPQRSLNYNLDSTEFTNPNNVISNENGTIANELENIETMLDNMLNTSNISELAADVTQMKLDDESINNENKPVESLSLDNVREINDFTNDINDISTNIVESVITGNISDVISSNESKPVESLPLRDVGQINDSTNSSTDNSTRIVESNNENLSDVISSNESKPIESLSLNDVGEFNDSTNNISDNSIRIVESINNENLSDVSSTNPKSIESLHLVDVDEVNDHTKISSPQVAPLIRKYSRRDLIRLRNLRQCQAKPEAYHIIVSLFLEPGKYDSFDLMPSFARNNCHQRNKRTYSTGPIPKAAHGNNHYANSTSRSDPREDNKTKIFINLTRNEDVKLNESENAWRPHMLQQVDTNVPTSIRENEEVFRKVRGILNKLTPNNFDALVEQILKLNLDTHDKVKGVMVLVFEKAIDEQKFSESYACLCKRLSNVHCNENTVANTKFRHALLGKTEIEFTQNVLECKAKESKLNPIKEEIENCTDTNKKTELESLLVEQERKMRHKSVGTVRFVGELFKIDMLTYKIINECVKQLLDQKSEDKLECLCKLLTTVGEKYEKISKNASSESSKFHLNSVMKELKRIISEKNNINLSSRMRFMLQDVIDLRNRNWVSKSLTPKMLTAVKNESELEKKNNDLLNNPVSISDYRRACNDDSNTGNRHDSYNLDCNQNIKRYEENWIPVVSKAKKYFDAHKLKPVDNYDDNNLVLGASSQFQWDKKKKNSNVNVESNSLLPATTVSDSKDLTRSNESTSNISSNVKPVSISDSRENANNEKDNIGNNCSRLHDNTNSQYKKRKQKKTSPKKSPGLKSTETSKSISQPPSFANLDDNTEETLKGIVIKTFSSNTSPPEQCKIIAEKFYPNERWAIIYLLLAKYIHLGKTTQFHREQAGESIIIFYKSNLLTKNDIQHGFKEFNKTVEDILIDVPNIWKYVAEFSGHLLFKGIIKFKDLCLEKFTSNNGQKFLKQVIFVLCAEYGPNFVRNIWEISDLRLQAFMLKKKAKDFINDNNFGFITSTEILAPPTAQLLPDMLRLNSRLKILLKTEASIDTIFDYISGNVLDNNNKDFIRGLTTTLINNSIVYENKKYIFKTDEIRKISIDILKYYIGSKLDRQVECLFAIQEFVCELQFPSGLFKAICIELYNSYILYKEAFMNWKDSTEHPVGKGVAVSSIGSFLTDKTFSSDQSLSNEKNSDCNES